MVSPPHPVGAASFVFSGSAAIKTVVGKSRPTVSMRSMENSWRRDSSQQSNRTIVDGPGFVTRIGSASVCSQQSLLIHWGDDLAGFTEKPPYEVSIRSRGAHRVRDFSDDLWGRQLA